MKVIELIAALAVMPQDAEVLTHFDGATRGNGTAVWLNQGGHVSIGELGESVYDNNDRAIGARQNSRDPFITVSEMLGIPMIREDK